ncbi:ribosomal protein S18 [Saccharata proteae CBS 121410]|uniref:Small ribosomal subunit protein bS18m n=1 Tax=Saccharata proteae CBS 121410 TaxID=1314787 RepID=A0A9P4HYK9_9PEZI|nr:ribosomal protein S18 [Saccharata proteae CBS 121410]
MTLKLRPSEGPSTRYIKPGSQQSATQEALARRAKDKRGLEEKQLTKERAELESEMPRRWRSGDVYAPHDLTPAEARKWRGRKTMPTSDAFDLLALNPINEYKNFSIMSEYMTEIGRIRHSMVTGLRPVNQRRIAKAIRRAIGIGIMPSVHVHPELLPKPRDAASKRLMSPGPKNASQGREF